MSKQFYIFLLFILPSLFLSFELPFTIETIHSDIADTSTYGRDLVQDDEIEITTSSLDRLMVQLCIGKDEQCIKTKLTSTSPYVWVVNKNIYDKGFDPVSSGSVDTGEKLSIAELYGYVRGPVYQDNVKIGKYNVKNMSFLVTNSENFKYDEYQGAIGMGYLYDNSIKEYSFLDKLHESLEINDKRFYIKYTGPKTGVIRFGDYPHEVITDQQRYAYKECSLLDTRNENGKEVPNNKWECALKGIYYETQQGDIQYILTNDRVQFSLGSNVNSFPKDIWDKFVGHYMQKYIDSGECYIDSKMKWLDVIYCYQNFKYEKLGEVSYIIGKWSLKFEAKDLFNVIGDKLRFGIYGHKGKQLFLLGYYLFRKYIVVFDKYKKKMGVYLNNSIN